VFEWLTTWHAETLWAVGLLVGAPALFLVLGEWVVRLHRRGNPLAAPLAVVRNLVLPVLAVWLLLRQVLQYGQGEIAVRVVETLLWVVLIHASLALLNVLLFAGADEKSWRARVPRLLRDLCRLFLVLLGTAIVLSTVWGLNLGQLVTALGIGSIVLGLALQEPLGNFFSGIVLLFERPFSVGDWIKIGDSVGKVVEINWRAVHVLTRGTELLVVPNSMLAKGSFSNHSRPTLLCSESITLGFSYDDPPNKVKRVLREVALRSKGVLADPAPVVRTTSYNDSSIGYQVRFHVADYAALGAARDEFLTRVWYAVRRHGLTMPYPIHTEIQVPQSDLVAAARAPLPPERLRDFPQFGLAKPDGLEAAVAVSAVKTYARGEQVVGEGEALPGLHLILCGQAVLTVHDVTGRETEIARPGKGEYFGEKALLSGQVSDVTVTALDDLEVLVLDRETLTKLLDRTPRLAREIGGVMEQRRQASLAGRKNGPRPGG
jgi:small-conductance mechanosensitive channel